MTQNQAVICTLERLGGIATLGQLNQEVFKIGDCKWNTKTPFASIRRIVQTTKGIFKIKPGLYALEAMRPQLAMMGLIADSDSLRDVNTEFNHTYYQGLLVVIGNLRHHDTYVPNQDANKIFYDGRKLGELVTLHKQPDYSYDTIVKRSSTIDTIWFNERKMPHSLFEVEHSTDFQNSLLKFNDLKDFYVRMVIVSDIKRKSEFEHKYSYSAFDELRKEKRVQFMDYNSLVKFYEQEMERQKMPLIL